jgi:O-antigen ligase
VFEEEHHGLNLPETALEVIQRLLWIALGGIAALGAGGNIDWARATLGAFGLLGPVLIAAYHHSPERRPASLVKPYLALMLPCWVIITLFLTGILHPAYTLQQFNGQDYWELLPLPSWMPVSAQWDVAFLQVLFVVGLYASTANALLIPNSRLVFARTWVTLAILAGFLALLGLTQYFTGAENILWMIAIRKSRYFSTFPNAAHWCAFAILWMGVSLGLASWLVRQRSWRWLSLEGWSLLLSAALLALSIIIVGDPLYWLLGALVAATGCFSLAWQTLSDRSSRRGPGLPALSCLCAAFLFLVAALLTASLVHTPWIAYNGNRPGADLHAGVMADTLAMWQARPLFGWGQSSFQIVYTFFQQADQEAGYWAYARSDLLQSLAENGLVGTLAWCFPALWAFWRILRARRLASFLCAPLAALAALLILAIVDFPFACPAVFFGFWLVLFSLARWNEIDDETSKSTETIRRRLDDTRPESPTLTAQT